MKRDKKQIDWPLAITKFIYIGMIFLAALAVIWPKSEKAGTPQPEPQTEIQEETDEPSLVEPKEEEEEEVELIIAPEVVEEQRAEVQDNAQQPVSTTGGYPAKRMTHYVMDGNDAGTCIAGRWCIGNQLAVAEDSSVRYQGYYVYAVHCSVVGEWRGSLIKVYYTDGGAETGIVLDCGGFAGHKDRMDKAMGTRYNGKQDNYTLSRYIERTEVIRKGW